MWPQNTRECYRTRRSGLFKVHEHMMESGSRGLSNYENSEEVRSMDPSWLAYQCAIEQPKNRLHRKSNDHGIEASWSSRMLLGTGDIIVKYPEP